LLRTGTVRFAQAPARRALGVMPGSKRGSVQHALQG
jgi:hypothetical protein